MKRVCTLLIVGFLVCTTQAQLVINEIMATNATTIYDNTYFNFSDWIELLNTGASSLNLADFYLSDDINDPLKWNLPKKSLGSGAFYLVYADKEIGTQHANFSLRTDGETIYLSDSQGNMIDHVTFGEQFTDISYGRNEADNQQWRYCITPTPGSANLVSEASDPAPMARFSVPAGPVTSGTKVSLSGNKVRYTTNGDEPGINSSLYSAEMSVTGTRTIKAKSYEEGRIPSKTYANTYFVNEHAFTLPVIALSFNDEYFYDNTIGIYVRGTNGTEGFCGDLANWNQEWERAAYMEYFDAGGIKQLSQSVGLKVAGGCTRGRAQKSLSIYARSKYGDNDFDYQFFPHKPYINTFKSVLLRNSGNDQDLTLLRDAFIQSLVVNSIDIDHQSYQPTTVYLNNDYFGIMNIREKVDEDYFLSNYNITSDRIDFLEREHAIIRGSDSAYLALLDYMDKNNLSNEEAFRFVESQIDMEECINYFAVEMYIGNRDWPENNIKYWKPFENGKWRWIMFDTDYGMGFRMDTPTDPTFDRMAGDNSGRPWSTYLYQQLMKNESFKHRFLNRLNSLMHTSFNPEWANYVLDSLSSVIDTEIAYNQERFGRTKDAWYNEIEKIRQQVQGRYDFMQGYMAGYFGLGNQVDVTFANEAVSKGRVKLNGVLIQDYPVTVKTFEEFPLDIEAVPEKGYKFSHWNTTGSVSNEMLITQGDSWKYLDGATAYPVSWNQPGYDDTSWLTGNAQLGYGDGDENTVLGFGGDSNNKIPSYLFRKTIQVDKTDSITELTLGFVADDGGIVYLNGTEVFRFNMNEGTVAFSDYAFETVSNENSFVYRELDPNLLQEGENVICCEVHQASGTSSDMSFDLSLEYTSEKVVENEVFSTARILSYPQSVDLALEPVFVAADPADGIYLNELASVSSSFMDEFGEDCGYVELYNSNDEDIVMYGFYLSDSPSNLVRFSIPDSSIIPAKGFLVVYADGNTLQGNLHTNFKLDNSGDEIFLGRKLAENFEILDSIKTGLLPKNYSFGKYNDGTGEWQYMYQTPGQPNNPKIPDVSEVSELKLSASPILFLYPNPNHGILNIELREIEFAEKEYQVMITDLTGNTVLPATWINSSISTITMNNQGNGIYLVHLFENGIRLQTEKLIIIN